MPGQPEVSLATLAQGLHVLDGGGSRQFLGRTPAQVHQFHSTEVGRTPTIVGYVATIHQVPLIDCRESGARSEGIEIRQSKAVAEFVGDGTDAADYVALQALTVQTVEVVVYATRQFRVRNLEV